jgi:ABC-2 type transport system permease protein
MIELFLAQLKWSWLMRKRYLNELIGGILITTIVFYGLFLSVRYIGGPTLQLGDRLDAIIVGYVLWTLVLFTAGSVTDSLQIEAQTGTLEQLFLTSYGPRLVLFFRAITDSLYNLGLTGIILVILMALTGRWLTFPPLLIFPLLTILLGAYGVAFCLGALALLWKKIAQLLAIAQFGFLFVLTTPVETWPAAQRAIAYLLPMTPGAGLMRNLIVRNAGLESLPLLWALLNGLFYAVLGAIAFRWTEKITKRNGQLGSY